eukprot:1306877-Amphidinium_carterae.1
MAYTGCQPQIEPIVNLQALSTVEINSISKGVWLASSCLYRSMLDHVGFYFYTAHVSIKLPTQTLLPVAVLLDICSA